MSDSSGGYLRSPTIQGDLVVFVCESDLWSVPATGGLARRLTASTTEVHAPALSPDGERVAFVGLTEGAPEVYVMPAAGGDARRLTFQGSPCIVTGWTLDGARVRYASLAGQPFLRAYHQWTVPHEGGAPALEPFGPADRLAERPGGGLVLGRNVGDPARWKRYRGGRTGELWVDARGEGAFRRLADLRGNVADPMWIDDRVWFLSDHEGHGNLYSCAPDGGGLRRHSDHDRFYARNARSDGRRIVYQCGAELWLLDPAGGGGPRRIEVEVRSTRPQRERRFVAAADYLEDAHLHPGGHSLLLTARGKCWAMGNWEGPADPVGARDGVRHRLARWLPDGQRVVLVSDAGGEEALEVHDTGSGAVRRLDGIDLGRAVDLAVSPRGDAVALANHRHELLWVHLGAGTARVLDRSEFSRLTGLAWSPDGRWLAYGFPGTLRTAHLRLVEPETGAVHPLTEPVHLDAAPCFDPEGRYLYFISYRTFDPVYDKLYFELSFPRGGRPYLITLQKELRSPFEPAPRPLKDEPEEKPAGERPAGPAPVRIDLEGIERRVVAFPVEEGIYLRVAAAAGKVFYDRWPVEGALGRAWPEEPEPKGCLVAYDLKERKEEVFVEGTQGFHLALDGKSLAYLQGKRLRVVKAKEKPQPEKSAEPGRSSGWIDLARPRVSVVPAAEWRQMYREAWRLQRDHFWSRDMSGIDWKEVYERYLPVLDRVATRAEFSDLVWELQGELGTSHAYEMGGDRPAPPPHGPGFLGANLLPQPGGGWLVTRVVRGDCWDRDRDSPLGAPGVDVAEGDLLVAIDGRPLEPGRQPGELLVNLAGCEVTLTVARPGAGEPRRVRVRTLREETQARYREWVEGNRRAVHEASGGRVGYLHVPDMGPRGFSEFHRYFQQEAHRQALVVDVRMNGGGHVSQLLLEKLARRRLGYDVPRWGRPVPYPEDAPLGPIVALTNEHAGSDGDIFSHCFKLMKLGPLVGKRTWGGVIGIWPRHPLVDRTITTQAEFAFWFHDVGWGVENYGTDPDIEVDVAPQDWAAGRDPQLLRAIAEAERLLVERPAVIPDFGERPRRAAPQLGPRDV